MGMASHNTDFLRWLTGREVVSVYAQSTTFSDLDTPNLSVMAQIGFEDGIQAHMWITAALGLIADFHGFLHNILLAL